MTTVEDAYSTMGDVAELDDFQVVPYYVADIKRRISVTRIDDVLYAFDDLCSEHGSPLSAGLLTDTTLMCQCGGCRWNVTTGELLRGPAQHPLRMYPVREHSGKVQIQV
ncbi:MAG: Rieske (2Fe-2S) protein [Actinomycetales bacterium]